MDLQQYKTRVKDLEAENEQLKEEINHIKKIKDKEINGLKTGEMELQWKYEKLYENFERFMGNETVGDYHKYD